MPERVTRGELRALGGGRESIEEVTAAVRARFDARGRELGVDVERNWWKECQCGRLLVWPKDEEEPTCPDCERRHSEDRLRRIEIILEASGVPRRFRGCTFESFQAETEAARRKVAAVKGAAERPVFIHGPCGAGKTHLATALLRVRALQGIRVRFETAAGVLLQLRASYGEHSQASELQVVQSLSRWPVLVLDDLGAEQSSEWARATLCDIIDRRYREERQTIVTSNLTLKEIEARIDRRPADRFAEGLVIHLDLPSWRRRR